MSRTAALDRSALGSDAHDRDADVSRIKVIAAFAAIYLFWGATFLAIRHAVAEVPPLLTIGIRCAGGAFILYLWLAVRGELEPFTKAQWKVAGLAGVLLFLGCHGVLAWAEQSVTSGQAALLMTSTPLSLVLLSSIRERKLPSGRILTGLALGVVGICVLAAGNAGSSGSLGVRLALVLGGISWSAGSLIARYGARPRSSVQSTAMQLAAGAVVLLAASLVRGEIGGWSPAAVTMRGWWSIAFLVICGTVLALAAYNWLLRVSTPAAVSTYGFVNPMVSLALAWAAGDETPSAKALLAGAFVLSSVLLIRETSKKKEVTS